MRQDVELTSFAKGEISPRLKGRTDYKGYFDACDTMLNMVVMPQGGATRRPGTIYANNVKDQTNAPKLVRFQFSVTQAYMLEFGAGYIRVYRQRAPIVNDLAVTGAANNGSGLIRLTVASTAGLYNNNTAVVSAVGGVPNATGTWLITVIDSTHFDLIGSTFAGGYTSGGDASVYVEIPTVYAANEIPTLSFTQNADTLVITCPTKSPYFLTRSSHSNWTITIMAAFDGPYQASPATTVTASATTGSVTLTVADPTQINHGQGPLATDVGRYVRISDGSSIGWAVITARNSANQWQATVRSAVVNGATGSITTSATSQWQLGAWSDTTGWPYLCTFWQQRLFFIGTNDQPNRIDGTMLNGYTNSSGTFSPSKSDGTTLDIHAVSWIVADDQVNAARWVSGAGSAVTPQMGIGTDGAENVLQAGGSAQALTPTSVQVYRETSLGAKQYALAIRINKAVLFISISGRKLYEWVFNWQVNGYVGTDKTVEAEHMTRNGGLVEITYQKAPYGVVWGRKLDGALVGMTYLPEQDVLAWHQHTMGGDFYGHHPIVEAICCMPSQDGTYDELWLAVKRTINGSVVRIVEVMNQYFDSGNGASGGSPDQGDGAVFVDASLQSALTYPNATLVASAMSGSGVTFTASAGTPFLSTDVGSVIRYNSGVAIVTAYTSSTVLVGQWYRNCDSLEPKTSGNWSMTPQFSTFSNLTYLVGQTVQGLGDGADLGTAVVDNTGAVTVGGGRGKASFATYGLPYLTRLVTMPWAVQSNPSGQGRFKTVATLFLRLLDSLGCNIGRKVTDPMTQAVEYKTEPLEIRSAGDLVGFAPPLFTGLYRLPLQGSHDQEGQIDVETSGPFPLTVLALVATGDVGELER